MYFYIHFQDFIWHVYKSKINSFHTSKHFIFLSSMMSFSFHTIDKTFFIHSISLLFYSYRTPCHANHLIRLFQWNRPKTIFDVDIFIHISRCKKINIACPSLVKFINRTEKSSMCSPVSNITKHIIHALLSTTC